MILRRITQHIKEQNWFAVGLDVTVVIVGIFLGMQVTDWNEQRKMKADAYESLSLLKQDVLISQSYLETHNNYLKTRFDGLRVALRSPENAEFDSKFINGLYQGLFALQSLQLQMKTYEALSSSGRLSLIDRNEILMSLAKIEVIHKSIQHGEEDTERFQHGIVDRYAMKNLNYSAFANYDYNNKSSAYKEQVFPLTMEFRNIMQFQLEIIHTQLTNVERLQSEFSNLLVLLANNT